MLPNQSRITTKTAGNGAVLGGEMGSKKVTKKCSNPRAMRHSLITT